ncbi:MAG: maleylpyruvate isomerase N-terminal domain-containing protein [Acidimicrobiales bacterium]|nr:maleylpyruvate isomerase N-terminal domain-containing protein [Acidimicrobiales bacterium]
MGAPGELLGDLAAEGDDFDAIVALLPAATWRSESAAPGWTVAHQVAHLVSTDEISPVAATKADAFALRLHAALAEEGHIDRVAGTGTADPPAPTTPRSASPAPSSTSASWSPDGVAPLIPRWSPSGPTLLRGSGSRSFAGPGPGRPVRRKGLR